MADIWLIADLHLSHTNLVKGWDDTGVGPRGHFRDINDHDDTIIGNWNRTVKPEDTAYILGDVAMSKRGLELVARLHGHKRVVLGNHDQEKSAVYARLFERVCGAKTLDGMVLTHVPVHPMALNRKAMQVNVHGHMHDHWVTDVPSVRDQARYRGKILAPDHRYRCVSCEQVAYTPIHIDTIKADFGDLLKTC